MKLVVLFLVTYVCSTHAWTFFGEPRIDPLEEITESCRQLARLGSCEFFTCLENRFPCGHDGYAISIGKHFCERGLAMNSQLNPEGKLFRNHSTACLTSSLLPVYESYSSRCGDIADHGASSMLLCSRREYEDVDFCSVIRGNVDAYNEMFGVDEISRLLTLRRPLLLTRLFVEGGSCGAQSLMDRANELTGSLNDFIGRMRDSLNDFRDRVSNWWNSVQ